MTDPYTYVKLYHYVGDGFLHPWGTRCPRPAWDGWKEEERSFACQCPTGWPKKAPVVENLVMTPLTGKYPDALRYWKDEDWWEGE